MSDASAPLDICSVGWFCFLCKVLHPIMRPASHWANLQGLTQQAYLGFP